MPKTALPEWILARFVGPDCASVILGDLLELSATRGRLWFWIAYTRTLVSLGWRTPVAFLCAYAFSRWIAFGGFVINNSIRRHFNVHPYYPPSIWHMPLGDSILALWFILPFVVVRFGFRDRLTQLASAVLLLTLSYFSLTWTGTKFAC